jgi:hypothetical protein
MFGLLRFLLSLALTALLIWFALRVPLGKHTLWGHLQAIFSSQEARDLAEGTREEARKVAEKVREELGHDGGSAAPTPDKAARHSRQPLDPVDEHDRESLDKLVRQKTHRNK